VGVEAARSPWVALFDSDDLWLPDKLALQVECAKLGVGLLGRDVN
jgi:hypothetical protein